MFCCVPKAPGRSRVKSERRCARSIPRAGRPAIILVCSGIEASPSHGGSVLHLDYWSADKLLCAFRSANESNHQENALHGGAEFQCRARSKSELATRCQSERRTVWSIRDIFALNSISLGTVIWGHAATAGVRRLGLTVPATLLAQADEVIE